ncbi:MAG: RtcB family protein [Candidatus Kapabacteria bacterium]|jgi:tRNA-splicing ligase RtcB|nr:RtcB family protein [Candidatus Kapabacteria bacterium]
MLEKLQNERIPINIWADDIENSAMEQVYNLANYPFAFKHIAIMPDAHQGYGMPIGGVMATTEVVVPNAVGVDIGCGMCAIQTSVKADDVDTEKLKRILDKIRKRVPLGFSHHEVPQDESLMPQADISKLQIVSQEYQNALTQIGTLGGGNHFIEVQKSSSGFIWLMIHSGSRNLGLKVAEYYNDLAEAKRDEWESTVAKKKQLSFLPLDTLDGQNYMAEMNYCVEFALANRTLIMKHLQNVFAEEFENIEFGDMINIAHNFAALEKHYGRNVMVHRKGATKATDGLIGIIPGSQGAKSYIVEGKGNKESFNSCSHGAGRIMGRKQAQRNLDLDSVIAGLDKQGIIHSIKTKKDLDEAPEAYKNIEEVMDLQRDLVSVVTELTPLAVIKG